MKKLSLSWLLIGGTVILSLIPWLLLQGKEFGATDGNNSAAIQETQPDYKPWFEPLMKDSGPRVQIFLFSVQAVIGAGVTGYIVGLYRGRSEQRDQDEE